MNVTDYRPYLTETVFQHLRNCVLDFDEKRYFASAVWGAVLLEAFLSDLAGELGFRGKANDDLNERISRLRQYVNSPAASGLEVPDEIVKRCDEIRNIRNRLVHHTGLPKTTLERDAQSICGALEVILDWYRKTKPPIEPPTSREDSPALSGGGVPVFISTISPDNRRQSYFLDAFQNRLRQIGVAPVRVKLTQYDQRDPFGKVRDTMKSCRGCIVLGLERSHAYFLRDKEGTDRETEDTHRKYTSGWLHLEAGIANALGLPVWVLCQKDICSDGVFDRQWNSYAPVTELKTLEESSSDLDGFLEHLRVWVAGQAATARNP